MSMFTDEVDEHVEFTSPIMKITRQISGGPTTWLDFITVPSSSTTS